MNRRTLLGTLAALVAWPFVKPVQAKPNFDGVKVSKLTSWKVSSRDDYADTSCDDSNWVIYYPIKSKVAESTYRARVLIGQVTRGEMTALQVAALLELWNRTDGSQAWKLLPYRNCTSHPTDWTRLYGEPHLSTLDEYHLYLLIGGFRDGDRPQSKPPANWHNPGVQSDKSVSEVTNEIKDHINGATQ